MLVEEALEAGFGPRAEVVTEASDYHPLLDGR